jgi:prepilin-type N-terminal cleavage/methylation domain-containing protein
MKKSGRIEAKKGECPLPVTCRLSPTSNKTGCVNAKCGFTLLEIIVVLTLISLLFGITAVHFAGSLPSYRLQATAREMSAALRNASALAKRDHETKILLLDINSRQYQLPNKSLKTIPGDIHVKVIDAAGTEILEGKHPFVFQPSGITECDTIIFWNDKKKIRIQIDPVVGAVVQNAISDNSKY